LVPARKQPYGQVKGVLEARQVLAAEILAQLKTEKWEVRQRDLLLQVAPVLKKQHAGDVERFLQTKELWVKRAALAALVYATENPKYLTLAAEDVQKFFEETKANALIADLGWHEKNYAPEPLFFKHYFFLDRYDWSTEERDKNLRILRGMLQLGIIRDAVRQQLEQRIKR
jgi:hypothetical protein